MSNSVVESIRSRLFAGHLRGEESAERIHVAAGVPCYDSKAAAEFVFRHYRSQGWLPENIAVLTLPDIAAELDAQEPVAYDPPITREAAMALKVLATRHPVLTPLEEFGLAPATAKLAADELISHDLAGRPKGPKKGLSATPAGLAIANKLVAKL